jgi:hypothetical protein
VKGPQTANRLWTVPKQLRRSQGRYQHSCGAAESWPLARTPKPDDLAGRLPQLATLPHRPRPQGRPTAANEVALHERLHRSQHPLPNVLVRPGRGQV